MKATITPSCTGCEECVQMVPEVFALTPDYVAKVITPEVPEDFEDDVRDAAANCPAMAIKLSE
jgi:ferredoxin